MPDFDGFPIHVQIPEAKFEAATYKLLCSEPAIASSRLLYHRILLKYAKSGSAPPDNISGPRLMAFEKAEGENNVWNALDWKQKVRAGCLVPHNLTVLTMLTSLLFSSTRQPFILRCLTLIFR
jgi:hypothetical protein